MCLAPCVLGDGICVEMMVDSGAQSSVISITLAQQLGLVNRIDRSQRGVASGVGKANIVGRINNVICTLGAGHVEFNMDFIVLDVNEKILLLGLDLMRRYKCILDLERDVLIFGGTGGVEVPLLPADEQHVNLRNTLGDGCTIS
jgi:DNA damage-inducible protein 1